MVDHRRIQRTLFRMQCDAKFARLVCANDAIANLSTGLEAPDLALLRELSPAGLRADPKDERRGQVLGNLATEFVLSVAEASAGNDDAFLDAFLASPKFHAAMAAGERLPHAFGAYASARARGGSSSALAGILELERAMVRVRRAKSTGVMLDADEVVLTPGAELVRVAAGLSAHADALRAALDVGVPLTPFRPLQGSELVLVAPRPSAREFALDDVHVEVLQPPVDELLELASEPLGRAARAAFAERRGATPADLETFVEQLVDEGLLTRG